MRQPSFALENFKKSIAIAETLLTRERRYKEPLQIKNFKIVQGLRGGALVLMVASFENYLKEVMEERLNELSSSSKFNFSSLPPKIIQHNHKVTLSRSLRAPDDFDTPQKISRLVTASEFVTYKRINPEAFSVAIRSNPNSERLEDFFKSIGHKDFFKRTEEKYENKAGKKTDVKGTLDSIIRQRHLVAHYANAISLSRYELNEYVTFLKNLSEICDDELYIRIQSLNK